MGYLEVKDMVFSRGEDGNLIAQEIVLEKLTDKPTVKLIPLTRGRLQEMYAKAQSGNVEEQIQADLDVIKFGLIEPKLTDEQIKDMKPIHANAITTAILAISLGQTQKEVLEATDKAVLIGDVKKKSLM